MTIEVPADRFRHVMAHFASGVCVVTSRLEDELVGMTVSSFTSVSMAPPLVGFFPSKESASWAKIRAAGRFCVNVLAFGQEEVCRHFASRTGRMFDIVDHRVSESGLPRLDGVVATIECDLETVVDTGDHDLALGRVLHVEADSERRPLLYFRSGYGDFFPGPAAVAAQPIAP